MYDDIEIRSLLKLPQELEKVNKFPKLMKYLCRKIIWIDPDRLDPIRYQALEDIKNNIFEQYYDTDDPTTIRDSDGKLRQALNKFSSRLNSTSMLSSDELKLRINLLFSIDNEHEFANLKEKMSYWNAYIQDLPKNMENDPGHYELWSAVQSLYNEVDRYIIDLVSPSKYPKEDACWNIINAINTFHTKTINLHK